MRGTRIFALVLATLPALPAFAGDFSLFGGVGLTFSTGNSTPHDDLNLYLEGDLDNFYLGFSTDAYNESVLNEVDLSLGYRSNTPIGLTYDVSYTRYLYPNDGGDCCGDIYLKLTYPLTPTLTGKFEGDYYPESKLSEAHLSVIYDMNDKITLTARVGTVRNDGAPNTNEWEVAAAYAIGNETSVKLHYYKGNDYDGYFGLNLNWDTTIFGG